MTTTTTTSAARRRRTERWRPQLLSGPVTVVVRPEAWRLVGPEARAALSVIATRDA